MKMDRDENRKPRCSECGRLGPLDVPGDTWIVTFFVLALFMLIGYAIGRMAI